MYVYMYISVCNPILNACLILTFIFSLFLSLHRTLYSVVITVNWELFHILSTTYFGCERLENCKWNSGDCGDTAWPISKNGLMQHIVFAAKN